MQIFVIDPNTRVCAQALDDRRLIKQILECAQLLSTAMCEKDPMHYCKMYLRDLAYKPSYRQHPVTQWVAAKPEHFKWTLHYMMDCSHEYTARFGKQHKCERMALDSFARSLLYTQAKGNPNTYCACVPQYVDTLSIFERYQRYLTDKWNKSEPRWTRTQPPYWYNDHCEAKQASLF